MSTCVIFMLSIKPKGDGKLAVNFDLTETRINQRKVFFTSPEQVFGFLLVIFRKYLGLNQEEMGAVLVYNKPYSKTGYAKLERGETSINIQTIFDLSFLTNIQYHHILNMYNYLLSVIAKSNETVVFHEPCGLYGYGNGGGFVDFKNGSTIKETYSAKLKNYSFIIGKENLDKVIQHIDLAIVENVDQGHKKDVREEIKASIKFRASCLLNSMKHKF